MNRYLIPAISGGFAFFVMDLNVYLGIIAGLILGILLSPQQTTKRVIIEDVTTGEIKIQPNDRATQRYIAGRGE